MAVNKNDFINEKGNRQIEDQMITVEVTALGVYVEVDNGQTFVIDESNDLSWWKEADPESIIGYALDNIPCVECEMRRMRMRPMKDSAPSELRKRGRPTTLPEPYRTLAERCGGVLALADQLGVSYTHLGKIAKGQHEPSGSFKLLLDRLAVELASPPKLED